MKVDKKYKILFICFMVICLPIIVLADEELIVPQYTESYRQWMELPEEERNNYIEPVAYETNLEENESEMQPFSIEADDNELGATSLPSRCTRQYDMEVKNQGSTNACWAYSAATVFDINYDITNKNKKQFSNMHMEYMTSNTYNLNGFSRKVNSGGNMQIALAYATNGMGIALEKDMPTTNVTAATLKNIQPKAKVDDYVRLTSKNDIKNYIYQYGVVSGTTYIGGSQYFSSSSLFNNNDLAYCCTNANAGINHAITLVGWDDNYTNASFPGKRGAYIVLNSYGTSFGDNGIYYIFYDDALIANAMQGKNSYLFGVMQTNDINYDYLYQHDPYGWTAECGYSSGTYAANVFTRQNTTEAEKLTSISTYIPKEGNITIYINANGNDVKTASATQVMQRYIDTPGYYTIPLDAPVILQKSQFVVGVKYPSAMGAEIPTTSGWCSTITSKAGESYISPNGVQYVELQKLYASYGYQYANACIKAFTEKVPNSGNNSTSNSTNNTNQEPIVKEEYHADLINYVFDYKYYADHNLDVYNLYGYNKAALQNHWNNYGKAEGRKSSCVFDVRYYVDNNPDLAGFKNNYVAAYNHFMNYGYAEYRKSSYEYDGRIYKNKNGDLKNLTSMQLIRHYATYGKKELRQASTNFDVVDWLLDIAVYSELNPDVARACGYNQEALRNHWYRHGIAEGRIASLLFDAKYYLKTNPDVANAYGSKNYTAAYNHFVNYGFSEGRQGSSVFSVKYYLEKNGDIKSVFGTNYLGVVNHFIHAGKNEPRTTSSNFSVTAYRQKNGDLLNLYGKNYERYFMHYLKFGQNEKRTCL